MSRAAFAIRWLFDSQQAPTDRFLSRWFFLRALGLIYFSAFYSLVFQIRGLIGPQGILPAGQYLQAVAQLSRTRARHVVCSNVVLAFLQFAHVDRRLLCWHGRITRAYI